MNTNLAVSVRARLLNLAKSENSNFNQILIRYALERFLYRLSQSPYAENFLLKGALLFNLWYDMPHRPTRDIDLLGFGSSDLQTIARNFAEIAAIVVEDGIIFDSTSILVSEIRKDAGYAGARVTINAEIANARCKTQIDIGFGDAVTPAAVDAIYPVLLADFPAPRIKTYSVYTVIAEKLHAIASLGMTNSRLKDYWDLKVIFERETIDNHLLATAINATFQRRHTQLPKNLPTGLTDEFANDQTRQAMWRAFQSKNNLPQQPLTEVVKSLRLNLESALQLTSE